MRIIYNTSFIIDEDIETAWIGFIRKNYISVLQTNRLCEDIIFTKVSIDQPEGKTYSLQLVFNSEEQQNHFLDEWLPDIEKRLSKFFLIGIYALVVYWQKSKVMEKLIMGIDPGTNFMGYAIIKVFGKTKNRN